MAIPLAIDTLGLLEQFPVFEEVLFGGEPGRFQLHRICVYTTIVRKTSANRLLSKDIRSEPVRQVEQAALDWQPDQEDDLDEMEVFHHLRQLAASSASTSGVVSLANDRTNATTTLFASVQCPTYVARAQGRPSSSFYRHSLRTSTIRNHTSEVAHGCYFRLNHSDMSAVACCVLPKLTWIRHPIIWSSGEEKQECVLLWQLQLDFVDLQNRTPKPSWRPRKRRRTLNSFLLVSLGGEEATPGVNHAPEAKRFKGVRYRHKRRTWTAEMKPPKNKSKVSFGEFRSQTEAARAVDAAFYYYGKRHLLNFRDTPRILSSRPAPAGLNEEDEVKFVKGQAKWLASMASSLPSSTPSSPSTAPDAAASPKPFEISEFPRDFRIHTPTKLSSLRVENADDWVCSGSDYSESPSMAVSNVVNYPGVEQPCVSFQETRSGVSFLVMSPPAISMWQVPSPGDFQGDVANCLLQKQRLAFDELTVETEGMFGSV